MEGRGSKLERYVSLFFHYSVLGGWGRMGSTDFEVHWRDKPWLTLVLKRDCSFLFKKHVSTTDMHDIIAIGQLEVSVAYQHYVLTKPK